MTSGSSSSGSPTRLSRRARSATSCSPSSRPPTGSRPRTSPGCCSVPTAPTATRCCRSCKRVADPETPDAVIARVARQARGGGARRGGHALLARPARHRAAHRRDRRPGQGRGPGDRAPPAARRARSRPRSSRCSGSSRRRAASRSGSRYLGKLAAQPPDAKIAAALAAARPRPGEGAAREGARRARPARRRPARSTSSSSSSRSSTTATQQVLVEALTRAPPPARAPRFADRILPLIAAGDAPTRSVVLKILLGMPDRRGVVRRYIVFSKSLAGWARDRALESMRAFGNDLIEPTIELLVRPGRGGARLGDAGGAVVRGPAHRAGHDRAAQGSRTGGSASPRPRRSAGSRTRAASSR